MRIMNYFRNMAREVKRYDAISRSPIYAHFSETLGGLSTIRAYNLQVRSNLRMKSVPTRHTPLRPFTQSHAPLQSHFALENEQKISTNISAWYTLKSCDRWLSIRLESLGNVVVLAAALIAVGTISTRSGQGSASSLAGFSLSFAMGVTGLANFL